MARPRVLKGAEIGIASQYWGVRGSEIELARYAPQRALTATLNQHDAVFAVTGTPALSAIALGVSVPIFVQSATRIKWERRSQMPGFSRLKRLALMAQGPLVSQLEVIGLRNAKHIFVENAQMLNWVSNELRLPVSSIPPGIDLNQFYSVGKWKEDGPIVTLGRLPDDRKNWPDAIAAFALARSRHGVNKRLLMIGSGHIPHGVRKAMARWKVEPYVDFVLNAPSAELPGLLRRGSVFLQTSWEEGLGMAALEAMACGLPVVSTATTGTMEFLDSGSNGIVVPLGGDIPAFASSALEEALRNGGTMSAAAALTVATKYDARLNFDRLYNVVMKGLS